MRRRDAPARGEESCLTTRCATNDRLPTGLDVRDDDARAWCAARSVGGNLQNGPRRSCRFQYRTGRGVAQRSLGRDSRNRVDPRTRLKRESRTEKAIVGNEFTRAPSSPRHTSRRARRRTRSERSERPRRRPAPTARHVRRRRAGPARGGRPRGGHRPQGGGCARGRRRARGSAREGERRGPRARSGRRRGDRGCQSGHFRRARRPELRRPGGTRPAQICVESASFFFEKAPKERVSTRRVARSVPRAARRRARPVGRSSAAKAFPSRFDTRKQNTPLHPAITRATAWKCAG